jgi:hypothetical protein
MSAFRYFIIQVWKCSDISDYFVSVAFLVPLIPGTFTILKEAVVTKMVKKYLAFYTPERFITTFTNVH